MKIYSVFDPEFKPYGRVIDGLEDAKAELMKALATTPLPDGVDYVPVEPKLQETAAMQVIADHCYGGMPTELGWCNGHNTKLNCLEYHRDSELNLGTEDFILLVARLDEIEDGKLDTAKIKAFRAPAGELVEVYAPTMHYAPCSAEAGKGFRVMIGLPYGTNFERPAFENSTTEDSLLWARNKWLLAHPETGEAAQGAYIGLAGENIDIANLI